VLPELGEEHIREMSFDLFAYRELRDIVADCEDRYHHIENRMEHIDPEAEECYRWKQSREYIGAVESFLVFLEDDLMNFKRFEYRGFIKTSEELTELFYFKFPDYPLLSRMEAVMEYVLDEYETLTGRTLLEEEIQWIREWFMKMYETTDVYEIYNRILEENGVEMPVEIEIGQRFFPTKDYGAFTFPAGQYQAVSIRIGEAQGKNFWCVLYPALCLSPAVADGKAADELAAVVGNGATAFLQKNTPSQKVRFALAEWWGIFLQKIDEIKK
jgi:hypothetical protein